MLTETRTVEVVADGTFIATEHLRPIRTRLGGPWRTIDTTLVAKNGEYAPRASTVDMRISGGGDGPLVSISRAGRTLSFSWPDRLPAPLIEGGTATFRSVIPDVDLIVKADVDGFSHLLRVGTAEAAKDPRLATLKLGLSAPGLRVEEDASGMLRAVDTAGGGTTFHAPSPIMWDSGGSASRATATASATDPLDGPPEGAKVADVAVDVGATTLALTPDKNLLAGATTAYPVYIDPQWKTPWASAWTMVSSGFPTDEYYMFDGASTEGVGFCDYSWDWRCYKDQVKRVMFKIPSSAFSGKHIISATFTAHNTSSYDCSTDRRVDLWRVGSFSSSTNWGNDNWIRYITNRSVSYCSEAPVEFSGDNLRSEVQSAADSGNSTISFGLKAYSESTMSYWKRFADKASLRVHYNVAPPQPDTDNLTSNPGGSCSGPTAPSHVNTLPTMQAELFNNDVDEKLFAQFGVGWDHDGDGAVSEQWRSPGPVSGSTTGFKTPPALFKLAVPSSIGVPEQQLAFWKVRAWDGRQWSPWSTTGNQTGCYFKLDTSVPAAPEIGSPEYPENPEDPNDPWHDGVGRYGNFTVDSSSSEVTSYQIAINREPTSADKYVPATPGGPVTVPLVPGRAGLNHVIAKAVNSAGTPSAATYYFRVKAGSGPVAHWTLDDPVDSPQIVDETGTFPGTVHDGVTLGVSGVSGTAMQPNGLNGYAATSTRVLDTSASFAVSTWARLPETKPDHAAVIATQAGTQRSGFELYYSRSLDRWIFNRYSSDSSSATIVRAQGSTAPIGGRWAHLVGVYDSVAKHIRLYINGVPVATTPYTTPWNAANPVQLGAGWYGAPGSFFDGEIDDVRLYDRVITSEEAQVLYTQHPTVAARWKLNDAAVTMPSPTAHYKLDEATGATRAEDAMGLYPAGSSGVDFGLTGKIGKAAGFNGTGDYAATTTKVLDTTKSFSVAAWAKLPTTKPGHAGIIATQAGTNRSGFELYYSSYYDRWIFNRYDADIGTANIVRAQSSTKPGSTWTHLVGVYDAENAEIRLYVGGVLQQTTPYTKPWSAGGKLQLGAGWYGTRDSFFAGSLDDVRAYSQALTGSQAAYLANGMPGSVSADDSIQGHLLSLRSNAQIDPAAGWLGDPPGGLVLDGVDDYADTAAKVLTTDESFTVAAWVSTPGAPTRDAAIISQAGAVNSGFTLRYTPPVNGVGGGYQLEIPDDDTTGATIQTVEHSSFQSNGTGWDHVAIVYDAFKAEIRLYVNGQLEQIGDTVSRRSNTVSFDATGPVQLGRTKVAGAWGEYWPGVIDDVWLYRGVATDDQIQNLTDPFIEHPTYPGP